MALDLNAAISLLLPLRGTTQTDLKRVDKGTGPLSFTRATTATRLNPDTNLIESVASGDLREDGRQYLNRLLYSEDFSQAAWTKTNIAVSNDSVPGPNGKIGAAQTLTAAAANGTCLQALVDISRARYGSIYLQRKTGSGTIQITLDGGSTWTTVAVTAAWTRLGAGQTLANPSFGVRIVTSGDAVYAWGGQVNDGSSATRYRKSAASPAYAPLGVLIEGQRTNLLLWSRDMTNAAWAKTNMTAALDQTGEDGGANSASSLLATAIDATCLQALTQASNPFSGSISIKRLIGAGAVSITLDGGATWIDVTASLSASVWYRALKEDQTLANPSFGIKMAVSGDKVAVDYSGVEQGAFASSRIPTTSAAVTRNADILSFPISGNISEGAFTLMFDYVRHYLYPTSFPNNSPVTIGTYATNSYIGFGGYQNLAINLLVAFAGIWDVAASFNQTMVLDVSCALALRMAADKKTFNLVKDGILDSTTPVSPNAKSANWSGATAYIGCNDGGTSSDQRIHFKKLLLFNRALTDAEMIAITA